MSRKWLHRPWLFSYRDNPEALGVTLHSHPVRFKEKKKKGDGGDRREKKPEGEGNKTSQLNRNVDGATKVGIELILLKPDSEQRGGDKYARYASNMSNILNGCIPEKKGDLKTNNLFIRGKVGVVCDFCGGG